MGRNERLFLLSVWFVFHSIQNVPHFSENAVLSHLPSHAPLSLSEHHTLTHTLLTHTQTGKAEYEQYTIDQAREMETLHHQHRAESQALKTRIQRLEESLADATRNEEVLLFYISFVIIVWPSDVKMDRAVC